MLDICARRITSFDPLPSFQSTNLSLFLHVFACNDFAKQHMTQPNLFKNYIIFNSVGFN